MEASVQLRWSSSSNSGIRFCQKWQHLNAQVMGYFCIFFNKKIKLSFDFHSIQQINSTKACLENHLHCSDCSLIPSPSITIQGLSMS